jgi:hypothetical protein
MLAFIGTLRLGCVINFSWPLRCLLAVGAFLSAPARMRCVCSLWMLEFCLRDAMARHSFRQLRMSSKGNRLATAA